MESGFKVKSMALESGKETTRTRTLESGKTIKSMDMVSMCGQMATSTKASGLNP